MKIQEVTYDGIRKSIVEYISNNPAFKDYNFTAPALSSLIDALAYVSHYHIRYANFALNESFLDTAQLRHNVVSLAKEVSYIPYQYTAARVRLKLVVYDKSIIINEGDKVKEGTMFTASSSDGKNFIFRNISHAVFTKNEDGLWETYVDAIEGSYVEEKFVQDEFYTNRFFLLNNKVDTDHINVTVYQNSSYTSGEEYIQSSNVSSFGPSNPIYYIQEAYNDKIEIYFGDGILSKKLSPKNIIVVKYLVTNGSKANNIVKFSLVNNISDTISKSGIKIECVEPSHSGADRESIESIKYNAPKFYQRQDRNVTTSDYNSAVIDKFGGWIDSITSWGGEDNEPPQYAKVFICIKPKYTEILSPYQKKSIIEHLKRKNLPCVDPVIVDPQYIDVLLDVNIDWNEYKTSLSKKEIEIKIIECINNFFKTNITQFTSTFKYSKFLSDISNIDSSIDSILTDIRLKQILYPDTNMETTYTFDFLNKIKKGSLVIGPWTIDGTNDTFKMYDVDGIVYISSSSGIKNSIGKIDYDNGIIKIDNYKFSNGSTPQIPVVVDLYTQNISLEKNYLLRLGLLNTNIHNKN